MSLYSPYFIIKSLQEALFRKYSGYLAGRVLDVGCGGKPCKDSLVSATGYVGLDLVAAGAPECLGSACEIPFKDGSFDSVLCTEVLEHLPDPDKAISEIKRVLRKDGYLYVTVPQTWGLHYEPDDYWRFTQYGIAYLLKRGGFTVVEMERVGGIISMVGQRVVDLIWNLAVSLLRSALGLRWAERLASLLIMPLSLAFYLSALAADEINKEDALGWAVLVRK